MPEGQELASTAGTTFALTCLGAAALERVSSDGSRTLLLGPGKPLSLLAYLAFAPGRSATREHLADLLWADVEPEAARHCLRHTLWGLRQRLGDSAIAATDDRLQLTIALESDRDAFLAAAHQSDFERAAQLYRGDFLPGFAAPGAADFEQWADVERYQLRRIFLRTAEAVVREWLAKGRFRKARQLAARARDANGRDEGAWRLLLECLIAANDRVAASLEADRLEALLSAEGRPPEPATIRLLERVRAESTSAGEMATVPGRVLRADLVGREGEFAQVLAAWEQARAGAGRHAHVVGGAGLGKSRLLADVHARLRAMGARTVAVRANPGEARVPYALASELAAAAATLPGAKGVSEGVAAALVALNPSLSDQYPVSSDRAADAEALRRRVISIQELVAAVIYEQPLAVIVDDVHWADEQSRQIIQSVIEKLGEKRLLVLTSARPGSEGRTTSPATKVITLTPLTSEETGALVVSLGILPAAPWSTRFVEELYSTAQGSPLLALETLRLALERGLLELRDGLWECADPSKLSIELARGGALRRRIEELGRHQGWLLLLLAVAGTPLDPSLCARAANRTDALVIADLADLEVRGLVVAGPTGWQPAHDLIAERAIEAVSAEAITAVHRALGLALSKTTAGDVGRLYRAGRHLALASDTASLRLAFGRWATAARREGDRRRLRQLAAHMLGETASAGAVSRLARAAPTRLRLGLHSWEQLAAAGALVVAATGATLLLLSPPPPPPDAVLVVARRLSSDSAEVWSVPLRREGWERRRAIDVQKSGRPFQTIAHALLSAVGLPAARPDGRAWTYAETVPDSGVHDVFMLDERGTERRLTFAPRDDYAFGWSPDGRQVLFSSCRWNAHCWADLGALEIASGTVRQLTSGDATDGEAIWSPEGTRIAFTRSLNGPQPGARGGPSMQLCWVTADGTSEHCFAPRPTVHRALAWYDQHQVIALQEDAGGQTDLVRVNLDTRESHLIAGGVSDVAASADGKWISCRCGEAGASRPGWVVYPTDRPDLRVPVTLGPSSQAPPDFAFWSYGHSRGRPLEHLKIVAPSGPVSVDAIERLRAIGSDTFGNPLPVPVLSWHSANVAVAAVGSETGDVHPRRPGSVVIFASAGGWREDSVRLVVAPGTWRLLLNEDWEGSLDRNWIPFGDPFPELTTGPAGRRAFWNRGDRSFFSGAYSRQSYGDSSGLGVEFEMSTPITALQDQIFSVWLKAWSDSSAVSRWDHRAGSLPSSPPPACSFSYPRGDGLAGQRQLSLASGGVGRALDAPTGLASGHPHRVRLQIFPDGRCGLAIDGRPIWVAPSASPLKGPYRIVLQGKSVGNRMLVGHLTAWTGVRPGVRWAEASP